jgi:hypothetical protein
MYWRAGAVKAVTAAASIVTVALLIQLTPQALKLPSINELREANEALTSQGAAVRTSEIKFRGREELVAQLVDVLVPERFHGKHRQHL